MFPGRTFARTSLVICTALLGGCGTYTPDIVTSGEPHATAILINKILNHAKCELREAVIKAHNDDLANAARYHHRRLDWLDNATAKVTIKLIAEEKGILSPGVVLKQLLPSVVTNFSNKTSVTTMQSSSVGLGATLEADATRTENIDYSYVIKKDFLGNQTAGRVKPRPCSEPDGMFLQADLKIRDWLDGATMPFLISAAVPSEVDTTAPDVLTHDADFIVTVSGSVTPSWTLVNVTANTVGNFATAERIATGDLTISLGQPLKVEDAQNIQKLNSGVTAAVKSGR